MFSLGRWSCRIQPGFLVSRPTRENKYKVNVAFVYAAITLFRGTFQFLLLATPISYLTERMIVPHRKSDYWTEVQCSDLVICKLTTPYKYSPISLFLLGRKTYKVWAFPVSLATTPRIVIYFLFLALLRCFSSGSSLSTILCIQIEMHMTWLMAGFPIRRFPDQSLLTAPRSLSQSSTSFIGNIRLGIHCSALEYLFMHWFWLVVGSHQLLKMILTHSKLSLKRVIIFKFLWIFRQFLCLIIKKIWTNC